MAQKGNDKTPDYERVEKEPRIGQIVCGWKLVERHTHFNTWQRHKAGIRKYRTCFPRNTVPNVNAVKTVVTLEK